MQTLLISINLDATIVKEIREIKTIIVKGIIIIRIVIQETIIIQLIQQILKVHEIETKLPSKSGTLS